MKFRRRPPVLPLVRVPRDTPAFDAVLAADDGLIAALRAQIEHCHDVIAEQRRMYEQLGAEVVAMQTQQMVASAEDRRVNQLEIDRLRRKLATVLVERDIAQAAALRHSEEGKQ